MIKKISIVLVLVAMLCSVNFAQITPPTLSAGEYWTNIWTLSYDYQTNGSVRYIVQDPTNPSNLLAIFMATRDSVSGAGTNRYIWFSYSTNAGRNWENAAQVSNSFFGGFPSLAVSSTGIPYVGMHQAASPTRGYLFSDVIFGAGSFSEVGVIPQTPSPIIWPHICVTTNGNVVFVAAPNPGFQGHYNTWNGSAWFANHIELTNTGGPSGNFSTEAGPGGIAFVLGSDYNGDEQIKFWTSNDNGLTFTLQTGSNAPPGYIFSGADTLVGYIDGGKSGIYVGNEPHVVYSVYASNSEGLPAPANTNWYKKAKIVHWSPSTGIDTVAGRFNMPNMTDTLTHALVTPVCQPSLGVFNGMLYCTFTAFLRGNVQTVDNGAIVNCGEIFITFSVDNGNTWTTPVNITNTPNIEEKHSSVVRNFTLPTNDSLGVCYFRDLKAGGWVNVTAWGPAPGYYIYKKLGGPIGIKQELGTVREYKLFQNYPNPFNPSTTISYYLQKNGNVTLKVYNVLGELVKTLVNGYQPMGAKEITFDGSSLSSGIYYYTLETEGFRDTKKMILVK
jgi:hypothetical protein